MSEGPTGNHKTTKECDCQDTSFPSQSNNFLVWHASKVYYMYVGIATVRRFYQGALHQNVVVSNPNIV